MEELTFSQEYQLHHDALVALINRVGPGREASIAKTNLDTARLWALDVAKQPA